MKDLNSDLIDGKALEALTIVRQNIKTRNSARKGFQNW